MAIPAHMKFRDEILAPAKPRMSSLSMIVTGVLVGLVAFGAAWAFGLI